MSKLLLHLRSIYQETPYARRLIKRKRIEKCSDIRNAYELIDKFLGHELSEQERNAVAADMTRMFEKYGYTFDDYFYYSFPGKTEEERLGYLSEFERDEIVTHLNKAYNRPLFDDKALTYEKYKPYYKRDLIGLDGGKKDLKKLRDFLEKYQRIIIKPRGGAGGDGVHILDKADMGDDIDAVLLSELTGARKYGLVAEELIDQDERMASFHPGSVNCIRISTVRLNDRVETFHSFVKIGMGDTAVDNMNHGGFLAAIDEATGVIVNARDDMGKSYTVHPESGVQMVGFTVPHWPEALALAKELAMITPSNRWTGWDLALSKDGMVMVEGNARGQFRGSRDDLRELLKEIGEEKLLPER